MNSNKFEIIHKIHNPCRQRGTTAKQQENVRGSWRSISRSATIYRTRVPFRPSSCCSCSLSRSLSATQRICFLWQPASQPIGTYRCTDILCTEKFFMVGGWIFHRGVCMNNVRVELSGSKFSPRGDGDFSQGLILNCRNVQWKSLHAVVVICTTVFNTQMDSFKLSYMINSMPDELQA